MTAGIRAATDELQDVLRKFGKNRTDLLPILVEINRYFGHIDSNSIIEVSRYTGVPIGEIHGVITFYSFLGQKKRGRFVIRLCRTISCDMAGKDQIVRVLEKELGICFGETTDDGMFSLEYTNCIGMCNNPPAMLINDKAYGGLTPERVVEILDSFKLSEYQDMFGYGGVE
ncbi:MAG: NAD(P)H-dependent oxidoreductase subunit E [Acidobacteria bacterium]|nr:NAD(P)H-dependent oxidoreductase subunit E [Acidobacteriota bacterium]